MVRMRTFVGVGLGREHANAVMAIQQPGDVVQHESLGDARVVVRDDRDPQRIRRGRADCSQFQAKLRPRWRSSALFKGAKYCLRSSTSLATWS